MEEILTSDRQSVLVVSVAPFQLATRSKKAAQAYSRACQTTFISLCAAGRSGRRDRHGRWEFEGINIVQVPVAKIVTTPDRRSQVKNLFGSYLPAVMRLSRIAWSDRSECVHVTDPTLAFIGVLHKMRNRSTFILDIAERPGLVRAKGSLASIFSRIQPAHLAAVSRFVDLATVAVPGDIQRVRSFGFRNVKFVRNVPFSSWRAPFRIPPSRCVGELTAVVVGSIFEGRGYELLIRALADARAAGSDVQMILCGPARGEYLEVLLSLADEVGVSSSIDWRGPISSEDVSAVYLAGHVGLVLYEGTDPGNDGLSNKIMECVASGRPVLAGALPENVGFVKKYNCGWLSEMNVEALSDALVWLSRSSEFEKEAAHCRMLGDQELNWETEFQRVLDFVEVARCPGRE